MLRRAYDWTLGLAGHRHALWALAFVAFIESSVFPIPPDVLLIPMILARPDRAFVIAAVATVASVLGGLLGYAIGWGLMESLGHFVLDFYGKADAFDTLAARFNEQGAWAVLIAGVTPFPYKVITIFSGATGLHLGLFIAVSILARALRFFIVAGLLWKFGAPIRIFIERWLGWLITAALALLIGGFYMVKYI
ncbi:YqaA family protein [Phaeovulum vinaykumarii]|uniref:Membrane protein YqaA, SNARE-associated domain n=1 Tax=Phaeovulum vinaykumarii TaxID=407234 RepID=A0A1N7LHR5_9RHOB|nr:YqaA family protein [Phaeovulum vinaykumarii]SIS73349.1 membrane protein YqaA, SNARE-associated domain [Phaeovulum vinaykumarii]SOC04671.1 membrane protein YqaA with SNARE-associated domain [Phaeovulum vinaykumarii]